MALEQHARDRAGSHRDTVRAVQSKEFLLAEFEHLLNRRQTLRNDVHNEVAVFFGAATAVGIAFGYFFDQEKGFTPEYAEFSAWVLAVLLTIGLGTLWRLTIFHADATVCHRGMNLIRAYFADQDPGISHWLVLPITGDVPAFNRNTVKILGLFPVSPRNGLALSLLNGVIGGALGYSICTALAVHTFSPYLFVGALAIATLIAQEIGQRRLLRKLERSHAEQQDRLGRFAESRGIMPRLEAENAA